MGMNNQPFWKYKKLDKMSTSEWESLCDGCGKCCLEKTLNPVTGKIKTTNISCRLLDLETAKCSNYCERFRYMDDCIKLTPALVPKLKWLPNTCAYRLVYEGKDLPKWHPLITKNPNSTIESGNSVKGKAVHPYLVSNTVDVDW
ncbi:YcgN family cysteine cluster protein [Rickettsiales bacterium LUAb2]